MTEIEKIKLQLEDQKSELERQKMELVRKQERINIILDTENQLGAIMGGIMRALIDDDTLCRQLHNMTPEEAAIIAKPIVGNFNKFIEITAEERAQIRTSLS